MSLGLRTSRVRRLPRGQRTTIDGHTLNFRKGADIYVDGSADATADGTSWDSPYLTMAEAFADLVGGETIYLAGRVTEQLVTPVQVFDVSIIGVGNRPRHADSTPSGGNTYASQWAGGGLTAAQANLRILQQGWHIENILFSMVDSDAAGIEVVRNAGSGDAERDASHAEIVGCRFSGAGVGVRGGATGFSEVCNHVLIEDCRFNDLTYGIRTEIISNYWTIRHNEFRVNTNHIVADLGYAFIYENIFGRFTTDSIELPGGSIGYNVITKNYLSGTYTSDGGYTVSDSTDEWAGNWNTLSGGITVADPG